LFGSYGVFLLRRGLREIVELAFEMNKSGKRRLTKEEILRELVR